MSSLINQDKNNNYMEQCTQVQAVKMTGLNQQGDMGKNIIFNLSIINCSVENLHHLLKISFCE